MFKRKCLQRFGGSLTIHSDSHPARSCDQVYHEPFKKICVRSEGVPPSPPQLQRGLEETSCLGGNPLSTGPRQNLSLAKYLPLAHQSRPTASALPEPRVGRHISGRPVGHQQHGGEGFQNPSRASQRQGTI